MTNPGLREATIHSAEVRRKRADWGHELEYTPEGMRAMCALILNPPSWADGWRIDHMMKTMPYMSKGKINYMLESSRIYGGKRMQDVTPMQRAALVGELTSGKYRIAAAKRNRKRAA